MIRFNDEDVTIAGEVTDVYFNDNRVRRILKSMYTVNSAITLPSLVLLIPVSTTKTRRNFERKIKNICFFNFFALFKILASFMDPSRDYILLLCLGLFPSICICQISAFIAKAAKKNRSVKL
jgi:hypothetical protein